MRAEWRERNCTRRKKKKRQEEASKEYSSENIHRVVCHGV
jgi:hypothetical protein